MFPLDEASLLVSNESDTLPDEADEPCDEADEAELAASAGIEAVSARPTSAAATGERTGLRRGMDGLLELTQAARILRRRAAAVAACMQRECHRLHARDRPDRVRRAR